MILNAYLKQNDPHKMLLNCGFAVLLYRGFA